MDNPTVYWGKIILLSGAIVGAIIALVIYLIGQAHLKDEEGKKIVTDSISVKNEEPKKLEEPKQKGMEEKPKEEKSSTGNAQNIEAGGSGIQNNAPNYGTQQIINVGEKPIPPQENFLVEIIGKTFKVRPKDGQWIQPFFMIPFNEKDSCDFNVNNMANNPSFLADKG